MLRTHDDRRVHAGTTINPIGYGTTLLALPDALPTVELLISLSDIHGIQKNDEFTHHSRVLKTLIDVIRGSVIRISAAEPRAMAVLLEERE